MRVLQKGVERRLRVNLRSPHRLIPVHIQGRPPPYFILGGLVFTQVSCLPWLLQSLTQGVCVLSTARVKEWDHSMLWEWDHSDLAPPAPMTSHRLGFSGQQVIILQLMAWHGAQGSESLTRTA